MDLIGYVICCARVYRYRGAWQRWALPLFSALQAKNYPAKAPPWTGQGGLAVDKRQRDPLDSHARIRSLVPALRAFFF